FLLLSFRAALAREESALLISQRPARNTKPMSKKFRVFATCDIGESIEILHKRGYEVEVYPDPQAPPKKLIIEKVNSGIDGLITTLRDPIDAEVFAAGDGTLKVVAQFRSEEHTSELQS